MSADQVIEQIKELSRPEDLEKVGRALEEHRAEILADLDASRRIGELRAGTVKGLTHDEVFGAARKSIREG